MPHLDDCIRITLFGQFRVEAPTGTDLTPRSAKAQALIALLATERSFRRSRVWLQDKLWSDRGVAQGAASLRQALTEIRKCLGPWADVLCADRRAVALDTARTAVVPAGEGGLDRPEFLEGMDARDPEFEDWLTVMRSRAERPGQADTPVRAERLVVPVRPTRRSIVLLAESDQSSLCRILEDRFVDTVAKSLGEMFAADLTFRLPDEATPGMLLVTARAVMLPDGQLRLRSVLEDVDAHRTLWSEASVCGREAATLSWGAEQLGHSVRLVSRIAQALASPAAHAVVGDPDANILSLQALRHMFSMERRSLELADRLLVQATEIEQRPIFDAWRIQLATIRFVERQGAGKCELRELSRSLSARAIAADPANSNVLCSMANSRLILENNLVESGELARMSVQANLANPLAWWSLANVQLYSGDIGKAGRASRLAQRLAAGSSLRFWTDFLVSLVAAVDGRIDDAIRHAEISGSLAPSFRPPLRYLTALYARRGQLDDAARVAARLKAIEPDFSIERMISDPDYPVSMMRNARLIDARRLAEVEPDDGTRR